LSVWSVFSETNDCLEMVYVPLMSEYLAMLI
jgi:hypothetical protein